MPESSAEPVVADPPPDWEKRTDDLLCPLCGYNLRGLTEPRCPECGYQFTWAGLMDDARNHHPWLFEHQKTKRIWALLKTWVVSQFPRRFWKAVQPTHTPRRNRLAIYSLVYSLLMIVILIAAAGVQPVFSAYLRVYQYRQMMFATFNSNPTDPRLSAMVARSGSVQAAVDAGLPYPSPSQVFQAFRSGQLGAGSQVGELIAELGLTLIFWPWVTLVSLLIFQQTIQRARIKTVHVARCVVYSSDVALLLILPAALILSEQIGLQDYRIIMFRPSAAVTILTLFVVLTYRLSVAYRRYLHFPHAVAVCISSQVIFILLMLYFLPWYIV